MNEKALKEIIRLRSLKGIPAVIRIYYVLQYSYDRRLRYPAVQLYTPVVYQEARHFTNWHIGWESSVLTEL